MKCPLTQEQVTSMSLMRAVLVAWSSVLPEFDFSQVSAGTEREFFPNKADLDPRVERVGVMGLWLGRFIRFTPFPAMREVSWGAWVTEAGERRSDRYGCEVAGFSMPEDVTMEKIIAWFLDHVIPGGERGPFVEAAKSPAFQERVQLFLLAGTAA